MDISRSVRTDMAAELRQRHAGEIPGVRCEVQNLQGLSVFALSATSNLLELVGELPFLFAAVSGVDEGVTHFRSQVGPAGWTNNVFRYHNNISSMSPWTRVNLLTGLGQYLLGVLSNLGHLDFRSYILLLLPAFPTCSNRSLKGSNLSRWFLW